METKIQLLWSQDNPAPAQEFETHVLRAVHRRFSSDARRRWTTLSTDEEHWNDPDYARRLVLDELLAHGQDSPEGGGFIVDPNAGFGAKYIYEDDNVICIYCFDLLQERKPWRIEDDAGNSATIQVQVHFSRTVDSLRRRTKQSRSAKRSQPTKRESA